MSVVAVLRYAQLALSIAIPMRSFQVWSISAWAVVPASLPAVWVFVAFFVKIISRSSNKWSTSKSSTAPVSITSLSGQAPKLLKSQLNKLFNGQTHNLLERIQAIYLSLLLVLKHITLYYLMGQLS